MKRLIKLIVAFFGPGNPMTSGNPLFRWFWAWKARLEHGCPHWYECSHRDPLEYRYGCDFCPGKS